jgi:hypothetical protein
MHMTTTFTAPAAARRTLAIACALALALAACGKSGSVAAATAKPAEERAMIERETALPPPGVERLLERHRIAPRSIARDRHLIVAARLEHPLVEELPKRVERLSQRTTRLVRAQLRPEECEQRVAPVGARRGCDREVGEERQALGLCGDHVGGGRFPCHKLEPSECSQVHHARAPLLGTPVTAAPAWNVTGRKRAAGAHWKGQRLFGVYGRG